MRHFTICLRSGTKNVLFVDFDWQALESPVVDVGGGIGSLEMALTKAYPNTGPNFVIFDIQKTIGNAKEVSSHKSTKLSADCPLS